MDEAERCHRLAILDHGVVVAEGAPEQLMTDLPLQVVEIQSHDTDAARRELHKLPEVKSLAQLGLRLHVLVERGISDPVGSIKKTLEGANVDAQVDLTRANLEDVFVAATLPGEPARQKGAA
jgi:ABC-2 type transport system ATP-binding protein